MWESKGKTLRKGLQSIGAVFYYLLYCPLSSPRRTVDFLKSVYFFQAADKIRRLDSSTIPTVPADRLFPALFQRPAQLLDLRGDRPSGITLFESYVLASVVRSLQPHTLFEFGTFEGATTLQLALNSPDDAAVYTLDLPDNFGATHYPLAFPEERRAQALPVGDIFRQYAVARKITQLYGDSATVDLQNLRGKVDFIFVDGDHGYSYVKSDSENAFSMLRPNGVILWHDYGSRWKEVTRFLGEVVKQQGKRIYHLQGTNLAAYAPETTLSHQPFAVTTSAASYAVVDRQPVDCIPDSRIDH